MKVLTDSSVMYSIAEGAERGITVLPLTVTIEGDTWLEFDEITAEEFLSRVRAGGVPTSSSPPPGLIVAAYDTDEEVIHLTMADGLSGSYQVACGLINQAKHSENVHVVNTRTLCIPHRVLARYAVELNKEHLSAAEVLEKLQPMIDSTHSYLIPEDFDFLKRNGRLTPLAARIVTLLKAIPAIKQTADGKRLERFTVGRKFGKVVDAIIADLEKQGVDGNYHISVNHADNLEQSKLAQEKLKNHFPNCRVEIYELGPAFITQGGPGCIAIQVIDISSCPNLSLD